uniref:Uncharacterized protein n=1 Tax=Triticum urartu TaxID=4572 RepID=A0A8R7V7R8_TRIUA
IKKRRLPNASLNYKRRGWLHKNRAPAQVEPKVSSKKSSLQTLLIVVPPPLVE